MQPLNKKGKIDKNDETKITMTKTRLFQDDKKVYSKIKNTIKRMAIV